MLIVAAVLIGALVVALQRQTSPRGIAASQRQPDLSVQWHVGPTLRELRSNFAVLRRPATAAEHAAVAAFGLVDGPRRRLVSPEYVRWLGRVDGAPAYLIVDPVFSHEGSGALVAHMMSLSIGDTRYEWGPENYLIFPTMVAQSGALGPSSGPSTYVSVVPDGVRRVKWRFACPPRSEGVSCRLPAQRVVVLPVHDNLVALPMDAPTSWSPDGNVATVTWYGADGLRKVFTNPDTARPFPGAPAHRAT